VWFPGVHCNVGGGYATVGLSDLALQWMAHQAQAIGLAMDLELLQPPLKPDHAEEPTCSQRFMYRALAIAKKINAVTIGAGMTPADIEDMRNVDWGGNYRRPVAGRRFLDDVPAIRLREARPPGPPEKAARLDPPPLRALVGMTDADRRGPIP